MLSSIFGVPLGGAGTGTVALVVSLSGLLTEPRDWTCMGGFVNFDAQVGSILNSEGWTHKIRTIDKTQPSCCRHVFHSFLFCTK